MVKEGEYVHMRGRQTHGRFMGSTGLAGALQREGP